ncbi:MAG: VOC family protein [Proteobacteria bacterium]|nr:VOC family protein [Pseudomonadota bacterium]
MIRIKRVKRMAVAVKDLDAAIENWKKLFGIEPFQQGEEPEHRYAFVAFNIGNTRGDGEMTIEFLAPLDDPDGEMLIGKFIREHGEGLYMITLETEGTADEVVDQIKALGLKPAWGGQQMEWRAEHMEGLGLNRWTENYIKPKDANGVLCTLASIEYREPEMIISKSGVTIQPK